MAWRQGMGLRRVVVGTAAEPPQPHGLRVRRGHVRRPGRADGRLRLGRGGAGVPCVTSLLSVRLVQQLRRVRGRVTRRFAAGLLRSGGRGEPVDRGLSLLRRRTVVPGDRFGRPRRGFRFAGLNRNRDNVRYRSGVEVGVRSNESVSVTSD